MSSKLTNKLDNRNSYISITNIYSAGLGAEWFTRELFYKITSKKFIPSILDIFAKFA